MDAYYTPEQLKQFQALGKSVPSEEIAAIEEGWTALLVEVRANRDLDPADPKARELADRWDALTERTTHHYRQHPQLMAAIRANYESGAFEGAERAPQLADVAFIERIRAARSHTGAGDGAPR